MMDSVIDGLLNWLGLFIAGWIYFLAGVFAYFIHQYRMFPIEALKLFDSFGNLHKRLLANLYFSVNSWAIEDEKLLQEFDGASRVSGSLWIVLSSMFMAGIIANMGLRVLHVETTSEQLNYGFWLLLIVVTVLWFLQSALKIILVHKSLQAGIKAQNTSTESD
jgi:hypothetical protein